MGAGGVRQFLTHLAVEGRVSTSTQNQTLCVLLFLYRDVLRRDPPYVAGIERARDLPDYRSSSPARRPRACSADCRAPTA